MLCKGLVILSLFFSASAYAQQACPDGQLTFAFREIDIKLAFALLADYSHTKLKIDDTIVWSGPLNFGCTPWKQAAQKLASAHSLHVDIRDGSMTVSR